MSPAVFFEWMLLQNRQVPKGVGTEMRALVASWGLLLRDEGAWSAVEVCRGLLGGHIGGSRVPKEKFYNFGVPFKSHKSAPNNNKVPPNRANNEPNIAPTHVQEHLYIENADLS